ncbi:hypothetical protein HPA17_09815, partial [Streptococcus suis]|nr:hypothetical protein [Streptococcus suis]
MRPTCQVGKLVSRRPPNGLLSGRSPSAPGGRRETNLPGAEGERPNSNPLGGRRETNLPGAEGERPDSNPLGGRRETNLPG